MVEFKVMEYNILHGFHGYNFPFEFEKERQELAIQVVKEQDPDVLVLIEASYGMEFKGVHVDYKKLFNYPHFYYAPQKKENGVAILSKYPIKEAKNYSFAKANFVRTKIDLEGTLINVDAIHPDPAISEEEKERFVQSVLRDKQDPYILLGDFNTCSDKDNYDRDDMLRSFSKFEQNPKSTVDGMLSSKMVRAVESYGLVDTYNFVNGAGERVNFTVPTDILSTDKGSGMRCDFIFCSKEFNIKDAKIIKDEVTEKASDHYPIYAVISI